jgi:hypothetical protein
MAEQRQKKLSGQHLRAIRNRMKIVATLIVFSALFVAQAASASEVWTNRLEVAPRHALALFNCQLPDDNLTLQLASGSAYVQLRLTPGRRTTVRLSSSSDFPNDFEDLIETWPAPKIASLADIAFRRDAQAWMVYVSGSPVARLPEPWPNGIATIRHPLAALPDVSQRRQSAQVDTAFSWTGRATDFKHPGLPPGVAHPHHYAVRAEVQPESGCNGLVFLANENGACHGFTARVDVKTERLVFEVWRGSVTNIAEVLATAVSERRARQWVQMEVRVFDDRVVCLADGVEIIQLKLALPPFGKAGIFTNGGAHFEEFAVASLDESLIDSVADLNFHTLRRTGKFREDAGDMLTPDGGDPMPAIFKVSGGSKTSEWIFGATDDGAHRLEMCILSEKNEDFFFDLTSGWQSPQTSGVHFVCRQTSGQLRATLGENNVVLDTASLAAIQGPLRLVLDAQPDGTVRGLLNGKLVVVTHLPAPLRGAGGFLLASEGRTRLSLPRYTSTTAIFSNACVASAMPTDDWRATTDGVSHLRTPLIGNVALRLPVAEPSALILAAAEEDARGMVVISVRNGHLAVTQPSVGTNAIFSVALASLPLEKPVIQGISRFFTAHLENGMLWIADGNGAVAGRCRLPQNSLHFARLDGFQADVLPHVQVRFADAFEAAGDASSHAWTVANADAGLRDAPICLWSKRSFAGDFCVEILASTFSGRADASGEMDLVMARDNAIAGSGCALVTTGWGPGLSRLDMRLFNNGKPCAANAPRIALFNDDATHRLVFRRINGTVTCLLDDAPALLWHDDLAVGSGAFGLRIVGDGCRVKRVRVIAESAQIRPFSRNLPTLSEAPTGGTTMTSDVHLNELLNASLWQSASSDDLPLATVSRPVLMSCDLSGGGIETFESRTLPRCAAGRAKSSIVYDGPSQGACLRLWNGGATNARLDGGILPVYDPVATPLLQIRWCGDAQARVSLVAPGCDFAFTEDRGTMAAAAVTGVLDNSWNVWLGMPLATAGEGPLRPAGGAITSGELRVASRAPRDQTGRNSFIEFADVARGPAVGPKRPLVFKPVFFDRTGITDVRYAIASGSMPWDERTDRMHASVEWIAITNRQAVLPDVLVLAEGIHHLVTKARNTSGVWSVVYDLPFVVNCVPPKVSWKIRSVPDRYNGTCLDLDIAGTLAPPVLGELRLSCNDKPLDLADDNGCVRFGPASAHLEIDWPWLLRTCRQGHKNGDTLVLALDGITDAAGNVAPAVNIPIKLALGDDSQPPAVLPPPPTTNFLVFAPVFNHAQNIFDVFHHVTVQEPRKENDSIFTALRRTDGGESFVSHDFAKNPWNPEDFQWLALSLRVEGDGLPPGVAPLALRLRLQDSADEINWPLPVADGQPFAMGHVDWRPGRWNDLLVNVRDLLCNHAQQLRAGNVREMALVLTNAVRGTVQIRGLAILAPWGTNDVLRLQSYDLNGVAGLVWQNGGKSAKTGLRPARLVLPPDDAQWLKVRVADRLGNLSHVFMIPTPPSAAPVPDNLPLEVDVENY